jgi:hypothetical protein
MDLHPYNTECHDTSHVEEIGTNYKVFQKNCAKQK